MTLTLAFNQAPRSCVAPPISLHLDRCAAGFHRAPAAALVLAGIEEQPAARPRVGAAAKLRYRGIADQVQRIERDAFEWQQRIAGIVPPMHLPITFERLTGPGTM